ncbi:phosphatase PAP2 family protein [Phenylobacterium sp.]|uniref:acid phosphatase n=1 Tax=Phenylobacterium sp. TaxID=1871053 RepID=UPI001216ADB2|nr:phosphatase PAP2 family protein [Phenylobacterium sp.]THD57312.1 MAG: phosphatase PAP2 family protein [Phenylobacterium sp.]
MRNSTRGLVGAAAAMLLLVGSGANGAEPAAAPSPAARAPKTLKILTPDQVNPARLLAPPPEDGSAAQRLDLSEVQRAYRERSPERYAQAKWDDTHESPELFAATLGPAFDLAKLPETAKLLALVDNEQSVSANIAKRYFLRNRPWAIDTSIVACDYKPGANSKTSYPSGHATLGYSVGGVLAELIPERAQAILARATDYAYSREVCGAHYPSDVEASHVLGSAIALQMLANPKVMPMVSAARAELRAAGLTAAPRVGDAASPASPARGR